MDQAILTESFKLDIDHTNQLIMIEGKGMVSFEEVMDFISSTEESSNLKPEYKIVADLRTINFHPSYEDIMIINKKISSIRKQLTGRIAIVTEGRMKVLADLVSAFSVAASIRMKSFNDYEDAIFWLQKQVS